MLSRKVLLVASLLVLLVEGDLEPQHLHPDTDSTSEEAPTESNLLTRAQMFSNIILDILPVKRHLLENTETQLLLVERKML
ncbi:uncharacterized protein LOC142877059 isoform X2 [Nelusetta ayraudi]|uniref:uncharacterized protein LOC142877059 isoform X2 n=1 Tax=Nelusetta ayraudi TaxID=303726 RepID=UPI003F7155F7